MWCDNCLLIFPLRHGAMALSSFIALYSMACAIFLFLRGEFLFFTYPEPQVYGGTSVAVAVIAVLTAIGASTNSYMWLRLCFFLSPPVLLVVAVRLGVMLFQLNKHQDRIIWQCNHGGQLWSEEAFDGTLAFDPEAATIPTGFCTTGFHSLYLAFAFGLAIDVVLQLYHYFLCWRMVVRLRLRAYEAVKSQLYNY